MKCRHNYDNDIIEFEAELAYDYGEIIEHVIVTYNVADNTLTTYH